MKLGIEIAKIVAVWCPGADEFDDEGDLLL